MPLRVLIVTGYGINEAFAAQLEREDCVVECSEDERESMERLLEESFDLVIVGARIRGINGLEFLAQLRRRGLEHPILFITAYPTLESATDALGLGVSAYMQLPCTAEDLSRGVSNVARRHRIMARPRDRHVIALAQSVRAHREANGWSLDDLARRCELDPKLLAQIESRAHEPTAEQLERLSGALDLDLATPHELG